MTDKPTNATPQATKAGKGGTIPPPDKRFGQPGANPRNNLGTPKYVREIRSELKKLLDPNLTISDYQKFAKDGETDSGLRAVFSTAILKRDYRTVIALIDQAWGKPEQAIDVTSNGETIKGATIEFTQHPTEANDPDTDIPT